MIHYNTIAEEISDAMLIMRDDAQATHLMRFFKCGKGEYGEDDRFLGLRVPRTRAVVKEYRDKISLDNAAELVTMSWHEIRLAGFLFMVELYRKSKKRAENVSKEIVDCYLHNLDYANNWDLVDLTAPYILGDWLVNNVKEREVLYKLAGMHDKLWHQRVAMVANWMLIRHGEYDDTFNIAEIYLTHPHDLIHKATGWMLREVGKHGGEVQLLQFLDHNATLMPRTMLRYAIERLPEEKRKYYMKKK